MRPATPGQGCGWSVSAEVAPARRVLAPPPPRRRHATATPPPRQHAGVLAARYLLLAGSIGLQVVVSAFVWVIASVPPCYTTNTYIWRAVPRAPAPAPSSRKAPPPATCCTVRWGTEADADHVIDLGAPRTPRPVPRAAPPARLYPGPSEGPKRRGQACVRRRKRINRRTAPNARLYRPAPPRAPRPSLAPRAPWPAPAPPARLDTASRAALRLSEQRRAASPPRLVVTLPRAYRPASAHYRRRRLDADSGESTPVGGRHPAPTSPAHVTMDATNRNSTSPEDCSDGNESLSAPSEFLAEFLSVIMRRQYAEALKYCRLILQYEPNNATARGFLPLLQDKARRAASSDEESADGSLAAGGASSGSQSSLEMDESEAAPSSGDSSAPDDNGNVAPPPPRTDDLANDNAHQHQSEAATLRRLRAHFTCSIK